MRGRIQRTDEQIRQFIRDNVIITGDCWIWQRNVNKRYARPQMCFRGKQVATHRASFTVFNGEIPEGLVVRHHPTLCNNSMCVNPAHLLLGTQADNVNDIRIAGNVREATDNHNSKLTEEQVRMIRASDKTNVALSRELGVGATTISYIRHNKRYKSVK